MNTFEENNTNNEEGNGNNDVSELKKTTMLSEMYQNWFLDYASYVILERAVPDLKDGLKPVQRRLLHSMKELDDGRYNKVANIIGNTMKYHPHGDASIGEALVQLGQKDILIDTQGNWGNILTGDGSAAPRYIEARLSKFALDIVFNPKTTQWKPSYDGRNKEPLTLPVKFPLLLAQGTEGIAVGLASKILPHNFIELIDACISVLKEESFQLFPDFPTGGLADFSKYNDGLRGGRVKIRARIVQLDKKTLCITELPFGKTTTSLIESVIVANDKGKIKIKKIEDNTAENVEILIHLAPGISPDQTIDALYAFTDCEFTLSPNSCVIDNNKPRFLSVSELLEISNNNTLDLLKQELMIKKEELMEQLFFSSLEKIFIEKRIYRNIEKSETWEEVIETIENGLEKYKKLFYRDITRDDIIKLTEIKIKRISKYDVGKTDEHIKSLEEQIKETDYHLEHLIEYAIAFYERIKEKYGKGKERKTEIRNFDTIEATKVAVANEKLYVNRSEGFAGTSLKKDEYVTECSDIDDIIAIREDGSFIVTKVSDKVFLGKNILHIAVFNRNDDRTIYNLIYLDGSKGRAMVKRCAIMGIQRDKEYKLIKGNKYSKILYLTANPNGEAEVATVYLKPKPRLKKLYFDFDFSTIEIKNKNSNGNILSKNAVRKIVLKIEGISTLSAINVWYDDTVKRLNTDNRGILLGSFISDDKIVSFNKSGTYKLTGYELTTHFDDDMFKIIKYSDNIIATAIYFDNESQSLYLKRFLVEYSDKKINFIGEDGNNYLIALSLNHAPVIKIVYPSDTKKKVTDEEVDANKFISVKSYKAKGKRLTTHMHESIDIIEAEEIIEEIIPDDDTIEISESEESENSADSVEKEKSVTKEEMSIEDTKGLDFSQTEEKIFDNKKIEVSEPKVKGASKKKKNEKKLVYIDDELKKDIEDFVNANTSTEIPGIEEQKTLERKAKTQKKESKNEKDIKKTNKETKDKFETTEIEKTEDINKEDKTVEQSKTQAEIKPVAKKSISKKTKKTDQPGSLDLFSQMGVELE